MRSFLAAAVLLQLLTACAVDRSGSRSRQQAAVEPAPPTSRTYALGTEVTAEGAVASRSAGDTFKRGGPIYLSVDVSSASTDQHVEVEWQTRDGKVVRRNERHVPETIPYATFESGPTKSWPEGDHRVVIMIGGRKVTELPFQLM